MRTPTTLTAALATLVVALAAGCGSAADQTGDGAKKDSGHQGHAVTVSHVKGRTTLDAPATKVVALEWTYAEDLLSLGVTPTGVADIKGYNQWITAGPRIGPKVKDVGTRQEPSLETIKALDPDVIVTSKLRSEANYEQLAKIAPTLMFDPYSGGGEYPEMRSTLRAIGTAVGREDEAGKALSKLDGELAAAKRKLTQARKDGSEVTVARGYTTDGAAVSELLTASTIPGALLPKIGLKNAWTGKADAYGMSKIDVEGYQKVEKSHLVYVAAKNDDIFAGQLAKNALWKQLDFVKKDRVHALDPGTWYFGGPLSTAQVADEIARALTS